jgi:hypothetical protein
MTAELQTPAPRRKRGASKRTKTKTCSAAPLLDTNGKTCPSPGLPYSAYLHFRMADGTELVHSNDAIARAGRCPHCVIDFFHDAGLFHVYRDETHFCDFDLDGPRDNVRRNGKDLVAALWNLGLPRSHPLQLFNEGGHC